MGTMQCPHKVANAHHESHRLNNSLLATDCNELREGTVLGEDIEQWEGISGLWEHTDQVEGTVHGEAQPGKREAERGTVQLHL